MKDAVPLKQVAPDIDTLVTGNTAERLEQPVAVLLLGRERRGIPAEPTVEPASGGQQRPLVGGDRIQEARTVRLVPVGLAKLAPHLGISAQPFDNFVDACPHPPRIFQRNRGLFLECSEIALPTEAKAERRVEHGAGIEWKL